MLAGDEPGLAGRPVDRRAVLPQAEPGHVDDIRRRGDLVDAHALSPAGHGLVGEPVEVCLRVDAGGQGGKRVAELKQELAARPRRVGLLHRGDGLADDAPPLRPARHLAWRVLRRVLRRRFVKRGQLPGAAPLRLPGPRLHPLPGGRRVVVLRGARLECGPLPDLVPGGFARSVAVLPLVGVRELAGPVPQFLCPGREGVGRLVADPGDLERGAVLAEHGPVAEKLQLLGQEPVRQGGEPEPFPEQRLAVKRPPFIVRSVQAAGAVRYGVVHVELGHPVPAVALLE